MIPVEILEIVGKAAHSIKNLLGAMLLSADLLQVNLESEDQKRAINELKSCISLIDAIVSNLYYFVHPLNPYFRRTNLSSTLNETLTSIRHLIEEKEVTVINKVQEDIPVKADPDLLRQVFLNLFLNSLQAMPAGGMILVSSQRDESSIEVVMEDTGCGIPDGLGEEVFEPFFTTKKGGLGLGLAVAKKIMEAHDGNIELKGKRDKGAIFSIELRPVRQQADEGRYHEEDPDSRG